MARKSSALVVVDQPKESAIGGGLEGAQHTSRETFTWSSPVISPDRQINPVKDTADARSRDSVQNDGFAMGVVHTHRDSIVGSQFLLNATPNETILQAPEGWAEKFQEIVEARFNLLGDSPECWFDAARKNTITGMARLAVGGFVIGGEVLATSEWFDKAGTGGRRPFKTAIQMVSPTRLSNPNMEMDSTYLRRGVRIDKWGEALKYCIRTSHPTDFFFNPPGEPAQWLEIPARKPWGRRNVIHILEQLQVDQTRGVSDMVAVLKEMRMTKKFSEIVLQNAVVNATYAAAVESELPKDMVFASMGAGQPGFAKMLGEYMTALEQYVGAAGNISIDGAKMPHLFPGTKLSLKPMGTPGGVGTSFEESLHRHTAAALGLSYEQYSKDYSKTNYSSARASMGETWKFTQSRKKMVADAFATAIYMLWLEEECYAGNVPLPPGKTAAQIWMDPVLREALSSCTWIGASRGQIDELKETQASVLRIGNNMSTLEEECARQGKDWRKVLRQRARENKLMKELGLPLPSLQASKPGSQDGANTIKENPEKEDD